MKLIVEAPINSLSFGNVSVNILREMYNQNVEVGLFPVGQPDVSAYSLDTGFSQWLKKSIDQRLDFLAEKHPTFKLWHFNGGENRKSPKQHLYTFYECSAPTKQEIAVCKSQDKTILSSNYSKILFENAGCDNVEFIPLGFDPDFHVTNKTYLEGVVHFGLMGKFEKRKHTAEIIKAWLKRFGNDNRYQLSCCITNPFLKPEQMNAVIANILEGKRYTNINFLPYLPTNKEVNELLNAIDIDLTGLSLAEGWNLPAFNATCLGKWSVVGNHTSHKEWANADNAILIEPQGTIDSHDGMFFINGAEFNQGSFFFYSQDAIIDGMEKAANKIATNKVNKNGLLLQKQFSYAKTVEAIVKSFD